jgi:hypothetical protein
VRAWWVAALAALVGLVGCGDVRPLANDPPRLLSVNGIDVGQTGEPVVVDPPLRDRPYDLVFEMVDPEGDDIEVWFPEAPPGLDFPPDATRGVLILPGEDIFSHDILRVVLWDDHPRDPQPSTWIIQFGLFEALQ